MLTAILVLIGVASLVLWRILNNNYGDIDKIPGPKPLPILGNVLEFGTTLEEVFQNQIRLFKTYGSFFKMWIGQQLVVVISDPPKVEKILGSTVNIKKSFIYNSGKIRVGEGLLTSHDQHWKSHRKFLTPAFHFNMVKEFQPSINDNSNTFMKVLKDLPNRDSVDMLKYNSLYALDVLSEIAMKLKIGALTNSEHEYITSNKAFLDIVIQRNFSLFKKYDFFFELTPSYRALKDTLKILRKLPTSVIENRKLKKKTRNLENTEDCDQDIGQRSKKYFIDILLDLEEEGKISEKDIFDEVDTFIFAGHDTISGTLSYTGYLLSRHQEEQQKVYQEIVDCLGTDSSVDVSHNDIQNMVHLDMFLKEAMRLYTTVPFIERELVEDITIDDLKICKGTTIQLFLWGLHRNPAYYPEPEKFNPERFLPENTRKRHPYAYVPFSAGPRNCIGQKYALSATKVALIKLLMNFKIEPTDDNFEPLIINHGVISAATGVKVKLVNRTGV